jgi:hypothetical protein
MPVVEHDMDPSSLAGEFRLRADELLAIASDDEVAIIGPSRCSIRLVWLI